MLKRNIAVLMIAGGLLGAHVNLAAAHQTAVPDNDRPNETSPVRVSYLDGRVASDIHAGGSCKCEEAGGSMSPSSSPFPEDNSRD